METWISISDPHICLYGRMTCISTVYGIVVDSDADAEYKETLDKVGALLEARA